MATVYPFPLPSAAQKTAEAAQALHDDIRARWSRFTHFEIGHLRDADDLATRVSIKYGLEKAKAESDVAALLKGRHI
jgi:uncharacterized protein (DUF2267 family)